jgi:hypothetical protein
MSWWLWPLAASVARAHRIRSLLTELGETCDRPEDAT